MYTYIASCDIPRFLQNDVDCIFGGCSRLIYLEGLWGYAWVTGRFLLCSSSWTQHRLAWSCSVDLGLCRELHTVDMGLCEASQTRMIGLGPKVGRQQISTAPQREYQKICERVAQTRRQPLLTRPLKTKPRQLHIPKTAGTAMKEWAQSAGARGDFGT